MPSRVQESVAMTQEMFYPLSIDISSVEFQQRLGHLIARYLSVCKFVRDFSILILSVADIL